MPAAIQILYVNTDNLWTVDGLKNGANGNFLNAAAVTVTLLEENKTTEVAGETWPKTVSYVALSNGIYQTTLPDVLSLVAKKRYFALVIADSGAGLHREWEVPCQAVKGFE